MDNFERDLLAKVAAVPVGEKLPLSRFARELDCSTSVAISGVEALVMSGKLDKATVRPPVAAEKKPRDRRAYCDTINGRELIAELQPFLDATRMPPTMLTKRAIGDPGAWGRWKSGANVRMTTVERVRAFVAANASAPDSSEIDASPAVDDGEVRAAPVPGAGDEAGVTVARGEPVTPSDQPTGQQLYEEILRFTASDGGLTLRQFAELMGRSVAGIANIAKAQRPKVDTIERVQAIIAGNRDAYVSVKLAPCSTSAAASETAAQLRSQAEAATASRRPGETLADAVKREAEHEGSQRAAARTNGGGVGAPVETNRERFARLAREVEAEEQEAGAVEREALRERELDGLVSPSSVLRRAQRDWPGQCDRVKAIAAELGVTLGEAWRRVIAAGVDCMVEDAADEGCGAALQRGHA